MMTYYQDGLTALHMAADNGKVYMVKLLLEKGADINARGKVSQNMRIVVMIGSRNDVRVDMVIVLY